MKYTKRKKSIDLNFKHCPLAAFSFHMRTLHIVQEYQQRFFHIYQKKKKEKRKQFHVSQNFEWILFKNWNYFLSVKKTSNQNQDFVAKNKNSFQEREGVNHFFFLCFTLLNLNRIRYFLTKHLKKVWTLMELLTFHWDGLHIEPQVWETFFFNKFSAL